MRKVVTVADLRQAKPFRKWLSSRGHDVTRVLAYGGGLPVPYVARLDRKILRAIEQTDVGFDMDHWHQYRDGCATAHCRAGWAEVIAGEPAQALVDALFWHDIVGALIYYRSTERIPDFFASNEDALADIVACAMGDE